MDNQHWDSAQDTLSPQAFQRNARALQAYLSKLRKDARMISGVIVSYSTRGIEKYSSYRPLHEYVMDDNQVQ
jgi:hypothetical protein